MKKVKFRIPGHLMGACASSNKKYCKLLAEVFNFKPQTLKKIMCQCDSEYEYATIVCTAEEFASFIIRRNQMGMNNWFKELKAEFYGCSESDDLARAIAEKAHVCDTSVVKKVISVLCKEGWGIDSLLNDFYINYTDAAKGIDD